LRGGFQRPQRFQATRRLEMETVPPTTTEEMQSLTALAAPPHGPASRQRSSGAIAGKGYGFV